MTLVRYEPRGGLRTFEDEMGRMMKDWWRDTDLTGSTLGNWCPAVDIKEEKDHFLVEADVPGVEPKDIDISLENNVLTLRGERKEKTETTTEGVHRMERIHGEFLRRLTLPAGADTEHVKATSHNGVLEIPIPKRAEAKGRKIHVTS